MRFNDAHGRKIVSTSTAETVGRVDGFAVDVTGPKVAAIEVRKGEGNALPWADIASFGTDAVTVTEAEKIVSAGEDLAPLLEKRNAVLKKRVLTTNGDELGPVHDVEFDADSGDVTALVLESGEVAGKRMIGIGSYAVVVSPE